MMKRVIIAVIWALLALAAAFAAASGGYLRPAVFFDWKDNCASYAEISRILENRDTATSFAVWSSDGGCAAYQGDWRLLTGDSLLSGQPGAVMISAQLALERFGNVNVAGREIDIAGRARAIDGVYETGVAQALIADADDYKQRNHMALGFDPLPKSKWYGEAKELLNSLGLSAPDSEKDAAALYSLCDLSAFTSLIPTRWSDFDGWRDNWDALIKRLEAYILSELTPVQAECLWECARRVLFSILSAAFALNAAFGGRMRGLHMNIFQ